VVDDAMQFVVNEVYRLEGLASQLEQAIITLESHVIASKTGTQS
jgi:hypothetical protein